jgi:hypothetical protein
MSRPPCCGSSTRGIVKLTNPPIQPLLAVAYSPCDNTTTDEPIQGQTHGMTTPPSATLYKRHRFPAEIISHCVWLYFRFSLSYRDVQEMMAEEFVHNVRKRGKALLPALIELLVTQDPGIQ